MLPSISNDIVRNIIHVDDDPAILRLVSNSMTRRGYKVISLSDPLHLVPTLRTSSARIVLTDLDMPGMDGLTLMREIKTFDGSIQIVVLTGMVSLSTLVKATRLGAEECIFKPIYDFDELGNAVNRAYEKMLRWCLSLQKAKEHQLSAPSESEFAI